ncbi:MAG: carbamoyltransferase HypF [Thermoplasmatales archaeon]|nr:carbamoyltransferase HypF [Thermoplasmatales archaeon]
MLARIIVQGVVQGVGFRPFVYRIAKICGLNGYVLNLGQAGVEIEVEGEKEKIDEFILLLKEKKPPMAKIDSIKIKYGKEKNYRTFEIKKSKGEGKGLSSLPPDIAICDECVSDIEKDERRKNYFFTTCTNCGPRFTITRKLPYDRTNTTMDEFEMCEECRKEYKNPADRRFHAQTNACKKCGPKIFLKGDKIVEKGEKAIWVACKMLLDGKIVAIKGLGGYHLSCVAKENAVKRLRKLLGRDEKPFALMVKDEKMAEEICYLKKEEREILKSYIHPILLLEKKKELPYVAPGLHNYGVMLPYTGLHHLLFKKVDHPLIMTSANLPGKPIIKDDWEIMKIGADFILYYNRKIYQRSDDSIVKFIGKRPVLIRRSRGYTPVPINLKFKVKNILALGAEENVTACFLKDKYAFLTQHIGNLTHYETFEFLKETIEHFSKILKFKPDGIACDLHPDFITTRYAEELAENIPVFKIQHHHAHTAKAMEENNLDEAIGIAIDGFGYGEDRNAWGGEVIYSTIDEYKRLGHLRYYPMPGGDLATKYPLRMLCGILGEKIKDFVYERKKFFPHGEEEIEIIFRQRKGSIKTSSCGRVLDAISALLDVCHVMRYEGEPAMKLESLARRGNNVLEIEPVIKNGIIETKEIFVNILDNIKKRKEDLAYSAEQYLADSFASLAIEKADEVGTKNIVIAGGCAYNEHIVTEIEKRVIKEGYRFFINTLVPCGDGGISFGQAVIANKALKI